MTCLAILLVVASPAVATEGGLGRWMTGGQITPFAGLIPPDPGWQWSLGYLYYDGDISASREVPISGEVSLGLQADFGIFTATGVYIWDTPGPHWNFASMVTLPYIHNDVTASFGIGPAAFERSESTSGLFDLYVAPVIASYHVSDMAHWSLGLHVYAPTASYDAERIANRGLNVWTVSPTVAYTRLWLQGGLEFSVLGAVDWYSKNSDTDHKNGLVGRLESLLILRGPRGFGGGLVAGWIQQLEKDSGPVADQLDGFKGRSMGIGPILTYNRQWNDGGSLALSVRYLREFNVRNRLEGDMAQLSVGFSF